MQTLAEMVSAPSLAFNLGFGRGKKATVTSLSTHEKLDRWDNYTYGCKELSSDPFGYGLRCFLYCLPRAAWSDSKNKTSKRRGLRSHSKMFLVTISLVSFAAVSFPIPLSALKSAGIMSQSHGAFAINCSFVPGTFLAGKWNSSKDHPYWNSPTWEPEMSTYATENSSCEDTSGFCDNSDQTPLNCSNCSKSSAQTKLGQDFWLSRYIFDPVDDSHIDFSVEDSEMNSGLFDLSSAFHSLEASTFGEVLSLGDLRSKPTTTDSMSRFISPRANSKADTLSTIPTSTMSYSAAAKAVPPAELWNGPTSTQTTTSSATASVTISIIGTLFNDNLGAVHTTVALDPGTLVSSATQPTALNPTPRSKSFTNTQVIRSHSRKSDHFFEAPRLERPFQQ